MMRRALACILFGVGLLVAACAPPRMVAPGRIYLPTVARTPNKLGMSGCPASCYEFGCAWCYGWTSWPRSGAHESVPMIWDETHLYDNLGGNSAWVMGFNEPDLCPGQACMTVDMVVDGWRVIETRFPDRKKVAPAWSHMHPQGLAEWVAAYSVRYGRLPQMDALAVHCYHPTAAECVGLVEQHKAWAQAWGVPEVWVTEFYLRDVAETAVFVAHLERDPQVTRYAPFVSHMPCGYGDTWGWDCAAWGDPSLLTADGQLTETGLRYAKQP